MIMHFYDKMQSVCFTNYNQILVVLVLEFYEES